MPLYISDCSLLFERTDWRPQPDPREILEGSTLDRGQRAAVEAALG